MSQTKPLTNSATPTRPNAIHIVFIALSSPFQVRSQAAETKPQDPSLCRTCLDQLGSVSAQTPSTGEQIPERECPLLVVHGRASERLSLASIGHLSTAVTEIPRVSPVTGCHTLVP